jgi:ATPase subunit of ABC transporter with duplicated ATPase domains
MTRTSKEAEEAKQRLGTREIVRATDATILTPSGRVLFDGLRLSLSNEHVALVGRNGIGKSTLLRVLSGDEPHERITLSGTAFSVPQTLEARAADARAMSHGELRRRHLEEARRSGADVLFLDEPTDDLDDAAVEWLRSWLRAYAGGVVAVSHDRRLLSDFRHFFVARESGCTLFSGTLDALLVALEHEGYEREQSYARSLRRLADEEEHTDLVARRKARKKQYGRCRELDRATPRSRLNQKRDYAQVSHGKHAQIRAARIEAMREWSRAARRALDGRLALDLPKPVLPPDDGSPIVVLDGVGATAGGRALFDRLDLRVAYERIAVVGPNGAGKTTLLRIARGDVPPLTGRARTDLARVGAIAQGATDWMLDATLRAELEHAASYADDRVGERSLDVVARILVAHKFPLALADRPLRSLSPGERVRAALICLFARAPSPALLVLDEPTFGLDLLGQRALARALRAWPGGLLVASHDRDFLSDVGFDRSIELGATSDARRVGAPVLQSGASAR